MCKAWGEEGEEGGGEAEEEVEEHMEEGGEGVEEEGEAVMEDRGEGTEEVEDGVKEDVRYVCGGHGTGRKKERKEERKKEREEEGNEDDPNEAISCDLVTRGEAPVYNLEVRSLLSALTQVKEDIRCLPKPCSKKKKKKKTKLSTLAL